MALAMLGAAVPAAGQQTPANPGDLLAGADTAQPAPASELALAGAPRVYYPADFASVSPRSALDMVNQIPGFSVEGGGRNFNQARGLGQASGNVLLNGQRIVTKAGSVTDELARIAAENVIRIELVEGSTLNIPGLSGRVANVIAESTEDLSVQFEWRPQLAAEYSDHRWLEGIVSVSGSSGNLDYTVAVEGRPFRNGNGGLNLITYGDGSFEERFSLTRSAGDDKRLSGSLRYETNGGTVASINAAYLHRRFHSFEDETVIGPAGVPPLSEVFNQRNRGHDFELGGDIDFALGPGRLKLIALDSRATQTNRSQSVNDPATGADPTGFGFELDTQRGERIGRGEYSWAMWDADWQFSFEAAFNRLDQAGQLSLLDAAGNFVPLPFPSGTGGVREERYDAAISYGRPLAPGLTMQLILAGEYSAISQSGNNALSRTFQRPKGSFNLAWAAAPNTRVSFRIDRRVGQLNFGDFLASVNLNDNNQNAGNNRLRPDQSWGAELEVTRDLGAWGSLTARSFIRRFEDFVTFLPTATGGEARGNIDWARVMGVELNGTLQLDPLGIAGGRIDLNASRRDSRYIDPVTGDYLPVQFAQPYGFEVNYRHDVAGSNWAYGGGYRKSGRNPYYRVSEVGLDYNIGQNLQVFVEHKDVFGLTVQGRVSNLLEKESVLDRSVFTGPRGSGAPLLFSEFRVREVGRVVNFTVKGSF
ncbi:TonB-dependent receptor plug domain-containing protein [Altererythrobacter sp. KTW20L]|uniref:TonB-dependent receptor plug domain-containing protein n=1 Tax=Altererythrobacter sp. KTW20L TaxID=2942210 RepID=UPI0020BEE7EE|nr:TonB-dependent receptor plug domain-containing protein [Altererythrobacter sp. KTW20L]